MITAEQIVTTALASTIVGAVSAIGTMKAIGVHIEYLKASIAMAHERIDTIPCVKPHCVK